MITQTAPLPQIDQIVFKRRNLHKDLSFIDPIVKYILKKYLILLSFYNTKKFGSYYKTSIVLPQIIYKMLKFMFFIKLRDLAVSSILLKCRLLYIAWNANPNLWDKNLRRGPGQYNLVFLTLFSKKKTTSVFDKQLYCC